MTPDPVYELHIEEKKQVLHEGVHVIYTNEEIPKKSNQNLKNLRNRKETVTIPTLRIKTIQQSIENAIASGMQALLCASSTNLTITDLNKLSSRIRVNSKVLQPYVNHILKNNDKIHVGNKCITLHINKVNLSCTDDSGNDCFWNSTNNSPPLMSQNYFATPNRLPFVKGSSIKQAGNIHNILTQNFEEPNIHEIATQNFEEPNIHEIATQNFEETNIHEIVTQNFNIHDIATQQFPDVSVSKVSSPNAMITADEDKIIEFDDLTEDPMNGESQNLLDDYGTANFPIDEQRVLNKSTGTIQNTMLSDDDCSTDMEEDLVENSNEKNLSIHNISKDKTNCLNVQDMAVENVFDMPTQILPLDDNISNNPIIKEELLTQSDNNIYDVPTQILEPALVSVSNIHSMETQDFDLPETQILDEQIHRTDMLPPVKLENKRNFSTYKELNKENLDILAPNLTQKLSDCLNQSPVDKSSKIESDKPFYNLTQDVLDDLCFTQTSSVTPVKKNPDKTVGKNSEENKNKSFDGCFATPFSKNKRKNDFPNSMINNLDLSVINDTPQNHYNNTQELLTDLLSQKKPEKPTTPHKTSNKHHLSKLINVFEDFTNIKEIKINSHRSENEDDGDDLIPSSQMDTVGDRYPHISKTIGVNESSTSIQDDDQLSPLQLFHTESFDSMCTPRKDTNGVITMELPDSQEIQRHVSKYANHVTIPESSSESEAAEESDSNDNPIVFKLKIPTKNKSKISTSPQKRTSNRLRSRKIEPDPVPSSCNTVESSKSSKPKIKNDSKNSSTNKKNNKTADKVRKRTSDDPTPTIESKKCRTSPLLPPLDDLCYSFNVMFTQINEMKLFDAVKTLGGKKVNIDGDVLVAKNISRTFKTLMAISQGIPIVSPKWITDSLTSKRFLDPSEYLIKDVESEKKFKYNLKSVLDSKRNFLHGWTVCVTPNVSPTTIEMKQLIECNGGTCITCTNIRACRSIPENERTFSVVCSKDRAYLRHLPPPHVHAETILSGILKQSLNLQSHKF